LKKKRGESGIKVIKQNGQEKRRRGSIGSDLLGWKIDRGEQRLKKSILTGKCDQRGNAEEGEISTQSSGHR